MTPRVLSRTRLLLSALLLALLSVVVLQSLTTVFAPGRWQWTLSLVSVVAVAAPPIATALLPPGRENLALATGNLAGIAAWALALVGNGRAGEWLTGPGTMFEAAAHTVNTAATPLPATGAVEDVLLTTGLLVAMAVGTVVAGIGAPFAAGGVLSLLLLVSPAATGVAVDRWPVLVAVVLLALLAWVATPRFSVGGLATAALATVATLLVVSAMPQHPDRAWNPAVVMSPVNSSVPDVMVTLAHDLQEQSSSRVFQYTVAEPGTYYFALATLAEFGDGRWLTEETADPDGLTVVDPRPGDLGTTQSVDITLDGLRSEWLPLPQGTQRVTVPEDVPVAGTSGDAGEGQDTETNNFDPSKWIWMRDSATAKADTAVTRDGDRYVVDAQPLLSTTLGNLDPATPSVDTSGTDVSPYLELPGQVPTSIADATGEALASVQADPADRLQVGYALEQWFQTAGFTYDGEMPYTPGDDPTDTYAVMEGLISQRHGFCVHFASTFAVMARSLGIPTRLAVGYGSDTGGGGSRSVAAKDLHAWPEILVDGRGWVAFEPTPGGPGGPGEGGEPLPAEAADAADAAEQTPEPPAPEEWSETPNEEQAAPETPTSEVPAPQDPETTEPTDVEDDAGRSALVTAALVALAVAGVLLILLSPAIVRFLLGRKRLRGIDSGDRPAQDAWTEFTATAVDLGVLPRTGGVPEARAQTPEALVEYLTGAGMLGDGAAGAASAAQGLASAVSAERFGGQDLTGVRDGLRTMLTTASDGLATGRTRWARIRAALLPASLFRRPGA
ncbi:transglutaminase family protein [Corynebacterium terpenotabidum]|uniref:Transglutaminase-like domain-containing protein n=1 Tax=Corynebacterium terpenotabidum Y-11 TaxID=1200352 RepID=S4XFF3_9CORY|nr:transglutaminase domain-containing protein [Corynebacterium terpenotabidum]AGP31862.1 hypothetical protein A606_11115 [Corynebacterium terpenotabidum Y-11]